MLYFLANWKMYLTHAEAVALAQSIQKMPVPEGVSVSIFPSMLALSGVKWAFGNSSVSVGVQHAYWVDRGAYTGAESFFHAAEAGASFALIGHSEQRHVFGMQTEDIQKAYAAACAAGLRPVLCVGETRAERDAGTTESVVRAQVRDILSKTSPSVSPIIAYEPVWAISHGGVGEACSSDMAKEVLSFLHSEAPGVPILYGGSVQAKDVPVFVGGKDGFDGVLVGHASTTLDGFESILQAFSFGNI